MMKMEQADIRVDVSGHEIFQDAEDTHQKADPASDAEKEKNVEDTSEELNTNMLTLLDEFLEESEALGLTPAGFTNDTQQSVPSISPITAQNIQKFLIGIIFYTKTHTSIYA
jgi:hypothetical protein